MLLNENIVLGIVKEVGDRHVVLDVEGGEVNRSLTEGEADELHQYLLDQVNLLIPIHKETHELFVDTGDSWNEAEMEELVGASFPLDEEHDPDVK
jgi:hypothetical protein